MKIAYLVSGYPTVSHTFIRREVAALRKRGLQIDTFSLRRTPDDQILSPEDAKERERTYSILPVGPLRLSVSLFMGFTNHPMAFLRTLGLALQHRVPGARAIVWRLFHFAEAILLARELRRRGISHVHSHFSNAGGEVGYLATHFMGISWSLTLHGTADFDSPTRVLLREKIAAAKFVACVSYFGRALALMLCRTDDWHKVIVARCGVDTALIEKNARVSPKEDRQRVRVLSVGRLSPEKGFIGLIDAFKSVIDRGVNAELRIVGSGPDLEVLAAHAEKCGLGDRFTLPGHTNESGVAAELAQADVFVMSSLMEGLPVVLMEAMTLGIPVIAPRLAGIPELVEHNVHGLLFHPANWNHLCEQLSFLLLNADRRADVAQNGPSRIAEEFEIHRAVEPLYCAFQDLSS